MPLCNFGSNQVDFGGIMHPASEIAIRSSMGVGNREKATLISPLSTLRSNSFTPFTPPTKSILSSVLGLVIPKMGDIIKLCNMETSKFSTGSFHQTAGFDF